MVGKNNKYKYKEKTSTSTEKFVAGTQSLNYAPDYSNLYEAQDDVYNRRVRQQAIDSTIQPITSSLLNNSTKISQELKTGTQIGTAVADMGSNLLEQKATNSDGTKDVGLSATSKALKYGAMGANAGAALGPIGMAVGGSIGLIGGAIYGGVTANKQNKIIERGQSLDTLSNKFNKAASKKYTYNIQGDVNSDITKTEGFAQKGKYKLKSEVKVSRRNPDDESKSSREMLKSYKKSDPNRYKLKTNKSVIVKTFK